MYLEAQVIGAGKYWEQKKGTSYQRRRYHITNPECFLGTQGSRISIIPGSSSAGKHLRHRSRQKLEDSVCEGAPHLL